MHTTQIAQAHSIYLPRVDGSCFQNGSESEILLDLFWWEMRTNLYDVKLWRKHNFFFALFFVSTVNTI